MVGLKNIKMPGFGAANLLNMKIGYTKVTTTHQRESLDEQVLLLQKV